MPRVRRPVQRLDLSEYPSDCSEVDDLDDFVEEDEYESEEDASSLDGFIVPDEEDCTEVVALAREIMTKHRSYTIEVPDEFSDDESELTDSDVYDCEYEYEEELDFETEDMSE